LIPFSRYEVVQVYRSLMSMGSRIVIILGYVTERIYDCDYYGFVSVILTSTFQ